MRIIALDLGQRRVGVAVSDPLNIFANALDTLDGRDKDALVGQIRKLAEKYETNQFVIGLPYRTDGKPSEKVEQFQAFALRLKEHLNLNIEFQDERFTTVEAHNTMKFLGASSKHRRENVDKVAATLILQTYLDRKKRAQMREEEMNQFDPRINTEFDS